MLFTLMNIRQLGLPSEDSVAANQAEEPPAMKGTILCIPMVQSDMRLVHPGMKFFIGHPGA